MFTRNIESKGANKLVQPVLVNPVDLILNDRSRLLTIQIDPGQSISSACHAHAQKQITVLNGYAEINLPETCLKLYEGQTAHIASGTMHEIANPGKIPLEYVEIRMGAYVFDDDHLR